MKLDLVERRKCELCPQFVFCWQSGLVYET